MSSISLCGSCSLAACSQSLSHRSAFSPCIKVLTSNRDIYHVRRFKVRQNAPKTPAIERPELQPQHSVQVSGCGFGTTVVRAFTGSLSLRFLYVFFTKSGGNTRFSVSNEMQTIGILRVSRSCHDAPYSPSRPVASDEAVPARLGQPQTPESQRSRNSASAAQPQRTN